MVTSISNKNQDFVDTVVKQDHIDLLTEQLHEKLDKELNKGGSASHEKMMDLIRRIVTLSMHGSSKLDQQYVNEIAEQVLVNVQNVQATYNRRKVIAITIASAALQIGGGLIGIGGAFAGTSKILGFTAVQLKGLSKAVTGIGSAGSAVSGIFSSESESERTLENYQLEKSKSDRETRHQSAEKHHQRSKETLQTADQVENARHSIFDNMAR